MGQVCAVDGQCRDQCTTARDCLAGQQCVTGTCADDTELLPDGGLPRANDASSGDPCAYNSDCPEGLFCRGGTCADECKHDVDCAAGLACTGGRCVRGDGGGPAQDAASDGSSNIPD